MFLKICLVIGVLSGDLGRTTPLLLSFSPYCFEDDCYIRPEINKKSWANAQETCKNQNSTLPIVDNPDRQRSVEAAIYHFNMNGTDPVWLGANASDNGRSNWGWLDGSQYQGSEVQITTDNYYEKSYAFVSKSTATVMAYASEPSNNFSYICQYNAINAAVCSNGTGRLAFLKGGRCYVKYDEKLSWFRARNNCTANNGDLASFSDLSLLDGIVDGIGSWVGLRHSQWTWHNAVTGLSSDVIFTSWLYNQPDDYVPVCINIDNVTFPRWRDRICNHEVLYICQVFNTAGTTSVTPAITSPSLVPASNTTSPLTISPIESQRNDKDFAVGLGIGIPCAVIIIALTVTVIVQQSQLRKLGRCDDKLESGSPVVADSREYSTPSSTSVVRSVEPDKTLHYLHLQNRNQLQDQQQYDQLRENQYEQL